MAAPPQLGLLAKYVDFAGSNDIRTTCAAIREAKPVELAGALSALDVGLTRLPLEAIPQVTAVVVAFLRGSTRAQMGEVAQAVGLSDPDFNTVAKILTAEVALRWNSFIENASSPTGEWDAEDYDIPTRIDVSGTLDKVKHITSTIAQSKTEWLRCIPQTTGGYVCPRSPKSNGVDNILFGVQTKLSHPLNHLLGYITGLDPSDTTVKSSLLNIAADLHFLWEDVCVLRQKQFAAV